MLNTTIYCHEQSGIWSYTSFVKKQPLVETADTYIYVELKSHISFINHTREGYVYNLVEKKMLAITSTWWDYG